MSPNSRSKPTAKTALVLTAGGARGAYQAGVLKRISELPSLAGKPAPFAIINGASAGAINGTAIAGHYTNFRTGASLLVRLWSQLQANMVFRTDAASLLSNASKFALDFGLGGIIGGGRVKSLVDASPLRKFLGEHLELDGIKTAVNSGLESLSITATGYHTGRAFTFVQSNSNPKLWSKSRKIAVPATITLDHVLASAAIPIVFPPVPLPMGNNHTAYFGDGAMRLVTPLSAAIRLGADRILAVGVRSQETATSLLRSEWSQDQDMVHELSRPPLSQIMGTLMNAIFLDHLDADVDHLRRMNKFVAEHEKLASLVCVTDIDPNHEPMRIVEPLVVSPSADIAIIAKTLENKMPKSIRYLMEGLGTPDASSADLTSYLLFDDTFSRELIHLGYRDAALRIDEIEAFLLDPELPTGPEVETELMR